MKIRVYVILLLAVLMSLGMAAGCGSTENAAAIEIPATEAAPVVLEQYDEGEFTIILGGEHHVVAMDDIVAIGPVEFYATVRGERVEYTGVSIAAIADFLNLDVSTVVGNVIFTAHDGHRTGGTVSEVFNPKIGFIAISQDGEPLGHWEHGGRGPFMLVFVEDVFAQRFLRYLKEIVIELPEAETGSALTLKVAGITHTLTIDQFMELGAAEITNNRGTFTALPARALFEHFGIDFADVATGRILALNGTERDFSLSELLNPGYFYIGIDEYGVEPDEIDGPFVAVFPNDGNNFRRIRGLDSLTLIVQGQVDIIIGDSAYVFNARLFDEFDIVPVTADNRNFTGIAMADIIQYFGIDISGIIEGMVISGEDGFSQPFTVDEMMDGTNFFLVFEENGQLLTNDYGDVSIMSVFAHDDRETRKVRGVAAIRLIGAAAGGAPNVAAAIEGLGDGEFVILRGTETWIVTMDDLTALGLVDFAAFWTGEPSVEDRMRYFTGVRLSDVLEAKGISLEGSASLITTSWDSVFQAGWSVNDALNVIYIVVGENGEPLTERYGPFFGVAVERAANFSPRNLQSIRIN